MSYIAALYERTKYWNLTKLDQHVTEMMITTGNKFYSFPASRFLIILQNANMVANGDMSPEIELEFPSTFRKLTHTPQINAWLYDITDLYDI